MIMLIRHRFLLALLTAIVAYVYGKFTRHYLSRLRHQCAPINFGRKLWRAAVRAAIVSLGYYPRARTRPALPFVLLHSQIDV